MAAFEARMKTFEEKRSAALAMGGEEKLAYYRKNKWLNARERLDAVLDAGSFQEIGLFAHSDQPSMAHRSPCDGKICGFGKIDGRPVVTMSCDLTVLGASSAGVNGKKMGYCKRMSCERGLPFVFMGEAGGARMPDIMGARGMVTQLGNDGAQYQRLREAPWVACMLGPCYGSPTWYTMLSDFRIMRKGAVLAVSSPKVTSLATGEATDPEEMGGWQLHSEVTGLADAVCETDEECLTMVRKFLSFLPSNNQQVPPTAPVPAGSGSNMEQILDLLPENPRAIYDMRQILHCIVDGEELFEVKENFARSAITALARIDGQSVGVVANNPLHIAGALDADACEKITSFLVLCDSYNIPIVMFVDTPGFLVGKEGERRKITGKIINFMNALTLVSVPKITIIVRKTYGQAFLNMGGGRNSDTIVAWPSAEISFMDPETGINVVYNLKKSDDPEKYSEKMKIMGKDTAPWEAAGIFNLNDVIDPRKTRAWLADMISYHKNLKSGGIGKHHMHCWPTSY